MSSTRARLSFASNVCPCGGATLDKLIQPAILAILAEGPLHGYRLADRIGRMPMAHGEKPDISGVYRFLKTMEKKGLVEVSWDLSDRGPAKKSYRITAAGEECLACWIETLEEYRKGITLLLKTARKALAQ
jgi:DNA-binding PadR family transcriptional regulator